VSADEDTDDDIARGLAAWGVPLFAERPPAGEPASRPPLAALIRSCLESGNPRYRSAIVPLLLLADEARGLAALDEVAAGRSGEMARWARWLGLATAYLAEAWKSELKALLGRPPSALRGAFARGELPAPEVELGRWGLRALAEEIGDAEGREVDWERSLGWAVRALIDRLRFERRVARA
jgi:hypothetical protein